MCALRISYLPSIGLIFAYRPACGLSDCQTASWIGSLFRMLLCNAHRSRNNILLIVVVTCLWTRIFNENWTAEARSDSISFTSSTLSTLGIDDESRKDIEVSSFSSHLTSSSSVSLQIRVWTFTHHCHHSTVHLGRLQHVSILAHNLSGSARWMPVSTWLLCGVSSKRGIRFSSKLKPSTARLLQSSSSQARAEGGEQLLSWLWISWHFALLPSLLHSQRASLAPEPWACTHTHYPNPIANQWTAKDGAMIAEIRDIPSFALINGQSFRT